jgi:HEAT repeat protein
MTEPELSQRCDVLVDALADKTGRDAAFRELVSLGERARAAVSRGLGDGRFEVRRWCALWLWRWPDSDNLRALTPLARDPRSPVRQTALVALSHTCPGPEVVPLLLERALGDESLRVRRQAVLQLAWEHTHPDLESFFADLCASESDEKLRLYAASGLAKCRAARATQSC